MIAMYAFEKRLLASTMLCLTLAGAAAAQTLTPDKYPASTEWPTYGHDAGANRFSPLRQITPANVAGLKPAWTYHLKPEGYVAPARSGPGGGPPGGVPNEADGPARPPGAAAPGAPGRAPAAGPPAGFGAPGLAASEATPIVVGGLMYIASPYGRVVALDPVTGKEVWVYKLPSGSPATRGVEYFAGDATTPPLIVVGTSDSKLFTLDAKTGALNTRFGDGGFVALDKAPTSPSVIYRNVIIVGGRTSEGSGPNVGGEVHAYDIRDGKKLWTFHTIPQAGEPNFETRGWTEASLKGGRAGVNVWGMMSVDVQRGLVFLPLGAPSGDLFGGDRPGNNLYGTSVVALDALTGKYVWHYQLVHHDIWDYDLGAAPVLFDVKQGGKTIPALSATGKSGLLYLLDRTTGKPIFGVEERPVMQSDVPGEKLSPTQPFPLKPAPIAKNSMSAKDLNTVTPELKAACEKFVADNNVLIERPPFAPNAYNRSAVVFPSEIGGANWGGSSFNPQLGLLFINVNELGQIIGTKDPASGPVNLDTLVGNVAGGRQGPYANFGPQGRFAVRDAQLGLIPCNQPPWGSLVAVNVHTGDIAWKAPLGVTEGLPADKQNTGRPNIAGSIATAGGLVFIAGTDDSRFRAFDARTGKELWSTKMAASGSAVPATYQGKDGKQYVVITATGGSNSGAPLRSDEVVAYALP
jgi:quinoprotein glucose dehydrogenase